MQKIQPLTALTTLLSMLGVQNRKVALEMQSYFRDQQRQNPAYAPEFDEIRNSFGSFLRNHYEKFFIVVDALDECKDPRCLAEALKQISQSCQNVKLLITSRKEFQIVEPFEGLNQSAIQEKDV